VAASVVIESIPSVLEQVSVVDRRGPAGAVDGHQDGKPDDHLGGGDDSDTVAVDAGYASITPLKIDRTDYVILSLSKDRLNDRR